MNKVELSNLIRTRSPDKRSAAKKKIKYGVGINDADYKVTMHIDGRRVICPAYVCWSDMLRRCYSDEFIKTKPTYIGTSVCNEWLKFSAFREWWLVNNIDGYQLDKDILVTGNKVYSPSTCIFVPNKFNSLIVFSDAARGNCLLGVYFDKDLKKYRARCKSQISGKVENIGCFSSEAEANKAWRRRRLDIAKELKECMDLIDSRIYGGIVSNIMNAN